MRRRKSENASRLAPFFASCRSLWKKNSTGESVELTELQSELEESRNNLIKTQQSLNKANVSLNEAKNELQKSKESLTILNEQIKKIEHKQTVLRRQRDLYAAFAVVATAALIAK